MKLIIGPEVLKSYRRLPYKVWYAFAEFIDNSTQSFKNNEVQLIPVLSAQNKILEVTITVGNGRIIVEDNSIGMDLSEINKAMIIGMPPAISNGRSKYGLGLKTAAFWFGNTWKLTTKKYGSPEEVTIQIDLDELVEKLTEYSTIADPVLRDQNMETLIQPSIQSKGLDDHYTRIEISNLNRRFTLNVHSNTKENLRSIYRYDLMNGRLVLRYNGEILTWRSDEFKARLRKDSLGTPYYKEFEFLINKKKVKGWAGVLNKGSRKDAGFSLLQNDRVIQGWPKGYKPSKLFGELDSGRNDLVNQRLVGELELDQFIVSHTKDEILFDSVDEEELDEKLLEYLIDFKRIAGVPKNDLDVQSPIEFEPIVTGILEKLQDTTFRAYVHEYPVQDHDEIVALNQVVTQKAIQDSPYTNYIASIGDLKVNVLINEVASPYDPYLIVNHSNSPNEIYIIINKVHPHWQELKDYATITRFIKECIYDGIAEWKAFKFVQNLQPDTIKSIKDVYLRFRIAFDNTVA